MDLDLDSLRRLNRLRRGEPCPERDALEKSFSESHAVDSRLAVYGTLAPGRANHDQIEHLGGNWISGLEVRGVLFEAGWGAELGYPALRWSMSGDPIPVELLVADLLAHHWDRLDAFEGPGYRRILVPVLRGDQVIEIANLYESTARPEIEARR